MTAGGLVGTKRVVEKAEKANKIKKENENDDSNRRSARFWLNIGYYSK